MEELELDRVIFIPAAQSPFKPESVPMDGVTRLRLIRIALAGASRWTVDDSEIDQGGVSYTIDTVRGYAEREPDTKWFYLIGADHVPKLDQWRDATTLARLLTFAVVPRPGESRPPVPDGFNVVYLSGFPLQISSSQIRKRIREGKDCRFLLPAGVWEVILGSKYYL